MNKIERDCCNYRHLNAEMDLENENDSEEVSGCHGYDKETGICDVFNKPCDLCYENSINFKK